MDSFYGGKPGYSFVIVKTFESEEDMRAAFGLGPAYTEVHYNEYVLINTTNRLNDANGRIYRRGYNYSDKATAGAIYVGTIVGPPGAAPKVKMNTFQEIDNQYIEDESLGENFREKVQGSYNPGRDLLPGALGAKTDEGRTKYNDNILWEYYLFRDADSTDATVYIGFKFPYLVVDFSAASVDPYTTGELASKVHPKEAEVISGNIEHPYYQSFHIDIPKGKKGDSFKNLRVQTGGAGVEPYEGQDQDTGRDILVYDFYNYDEKPDPDPVTYYLGNYNMIKSISLGDNGELRIDYSHENDYVKWLRWPTNITLAEDGTITVTYNNNGDGSKIPDPATLGQKIQWINSVTLDDNGNFTVTYNTREDSGANKTYKNQLDWIKSAALDVSNGTLTFTHTKNEPNTTYLQWVKNLDVGEDGTITLYYTNNGTNDKNYSAPLKNKVKWVNKVEITDSKIETTFNDGNTVSHEYNYIVKTAITDNYELLVHYSNSTRNTTPSETCVRYNGEDWQKIGVLKDESGILIGLNLTTVTTGVDVVSYLNKTYPSGLQGTDLRGKIVTVGDADVDKKFYAFDYVTKRWFYLGEFGSGGSTTDVSSYLQFGTSVTPPDSLPIGGVYFQIEE